MDVGQLVRFVVIDAASRGRGRRRTPEHLDRHLEAAMHWLCRAQDAFAPGGVSIDYSLARGWRPGYPETTGYIIPTFIRYAAISGHREYVDRAIRMADWELSIQREDGSFEGGSVGSNLGPFVFDTGQVLFGLLEAHRNTQDPRYLRGARKAADWLLAVQDAQGMWRRYTYNGIPHAYYTRVAWGLAELGRYTEIRAYQDAACRNVEWALAQQGDNGWFGSAGFTEAGHTAPFTHTIAYTIEGILETGLCLGRESYVDAAARSADALIRICEGGMFRGRYDRDWNSRDRYSCLTGNAQIAAILFRLYQARGAAEYLPIAQAINRATCRCQLTTGAPQTAGAISGSYPIWGGYRRYAFPNWAAKFFADALILERDTLVGR